MSKDDITIKAIARCRVLIKENHGRAEFLQKYLERETDIDEVDTVLSLMSAAYRVATDLEFVTEALELHLPPKSKKNG